MEGYKVTATRQDAWTEDDDLLLAEVVLRHIREGSTQLNAFEEVGYRLNRTSAACGFRWNSLVRKKYEAAIQIAKAQRKERKAKGLNRVSYKQEFEEHINGEAEVALHEDISISANQVDQELNQVEQAIRILEQQKASLTSVRQLEQQLNEKEKEIGNLLNQNQALQKELKSIQAKYQTINEDYKALIQIMDRARQLAILSNEEDKIKFKLDLNGNVDRIERG